MNNISWIDLVLRHIPEGFIIILAGYAVANKKFDVRLYILASLLLSIVNFSIKLLPLTSIIHMVLSMIVAIVILVSINKIKTSFAIVSTIICFVLTLLTETINMLLLGSLFNVETTKIFQESTPLLRNLYGLPSLLLFGLIVVLYYFISKRKKKNVPNR